MTSTIVCGVDTSDAALPVAESADWLARGLGARLVVLHIAEEPKPEGDELLATIRDRLSADAADVRQVEGAPADRLLEAVEHAGAEMLVVGSRGRGSLRAAVFGSVSRRLSNDATCPVVVVPPDVSAPGGEDHGGSSIVCGVDGSEHSTAAARLGAELARRLGFRLIVVHALADLSAYVSYPGARDTAPGPSAQPDAARRIADSIVDEAVQAVGGNATGIVEPGLPWDVLQAVADRENGKILVVAARGLSAARAALLGSAATSLATNGRHLLAILPEAAEHGSDRGTPAGA
jgi:nucleotide-binding universal stress UspA family protein